MSERGEATLLSVLLVTVLAGLVLLCSLELQRAFHLLQKRTKVFLCAKEVKGEIRQHLRFMGRTNWGIKNTHRAGLIALFIPGLQGAAMEGQKIKKLLIQLQTLELVSYLKKLAALRAKGCSLDPQIFITPYRIGSGVHQRDTSGQAILRETAWDYYFIQKPYSLKLAFSNSGLKIESSASGGTWSSHSSSAW